MVKEISPKKLKEMMANDPKVRIVDVRSLGERMLCALPDTDHLPLNLIFSGQLGSFSKDETIVFYCVSGGRSAAAAEVFLRNGFEKVYNLAGGTNAWFG